MVFIYGLFPLPLGLAWGRAKLEWEAYAETLRATAEVYGVDGAKKPELGDEILRRFVGPDYGWMWPFPKVIRGWLSREIANLEQANRR